MANLFVVRPRPDPGPAASADRPARARPPSARRPGRGRGAAAHRPRAARPRRAHAGRHAAARHRRPPRAAARRSRRGRARARRRRGRRPGQPRPDPRHRRLAADRGARHRPVARRRRRPPGPRRGLPAGRADDRRRRSTPRAVALNGPVGTAVHRVAREGLANVARHAPGNRVTLSVDVVRRRRAPRRRRPRPAGDTAGPEAMQFGLVGMAERARALGGQFEAGPTADGWRVEVRCCSWSP